MPSKQDQERLKKSIQVLFGIIARQLLTKNPEPYVVSESSIESNGTRAKRTTRVLREAGYMRHGVPVSGVHSSYGTYYRVDEQKFKEESPSYVGTDIDFSYTTMYSDVNSVLSNHYAHSTHINAGGQTPRHLSNCGTRKIGGSSANRVGLTDKEALTVWWNRDDYVFDGSLDWNDCEKPETVLLRSVYNEYDREMSRAIVDVYVKYNLHILLPADMGLSRRGSQDNIISTLTENFMHHKTFLDDTHFKSMEETYEEQLKYAQSMLRAYQAIRELREKAGGLEPYTAHLRRAAIKRIVEEAPLHMCSKDEESHFHDTFKYGVMSRYVLQHMEAFDYDFLYGEAKNDYLLDDPNEDVPLGFNDKDANLMIKLWDKGETEEADV
ncbi:MAG: hypothetical protein GF334_13810 [Candidatus Altiarchaeales archaeon]|nr:hypothetical protein [Candidatus Altiarchaeales archaeon]